MKPSEIIRSYRAGKMELAELIETLAHYNYTRPERYNRKRGESILTIERHEEEADYDVEGSWDEVRRARDVGDLTNDEYLAIVTRVWEVKAPDRVEKFNPYHDKSGRFAPAPGLSAGVQPSRLQSALARHQGFSVRTTTGNSPKTGFMVALRGYEETFTAKGLSKEQVRQRIVEYAQKHAQILRGRGHYMGAWHDQTDDTVYLDVSRRVGSKAGAIALGKKEGQKAVYDLNNKRGVRLDGKVEKASGEGELVYIPFDQDNLDAGVEALWQSIEEGRRKRGEQQSG